MCKKKKKIQKFNIKNVDSNVDGNVDKINFHSNRENHNKLRVNAS